MNPLRRSDFMSSGGDLYAIFTQVRCFSIKPQIGSSKERTMEIREYTEYNEKDIEHLYTEVGWTAYINNLPILRRGFENSLLVLAAFEKSELIPFGK